MANARAARTAHAYATVVLATDHPSMPFVRAFAQVGQDDQQVKNLLLART
jgi:hypothetical protein